MRDKPDLLDIRIIEGLGEYGPRNIAKVAKKLAIPRVTLISRMKRMSSLFYLRTHATVYHTNLGLKKSVVLAKASPGNEELLFNCLKVNKFYIYLTRFYGNYEGCLGIYVIPKGHNDKFEQFIREIEGLGAAQDVELNWSTCFHTVNRTSNWFDKGSEKWIFQWDKWVEEVPMEDRDLPYTLIDPPDFPVKADETDLFILKELEKDATISLREIAKKLGTTLQNTHYHYKQHIIKRGLIETFQIGFLPFEKALSDMFFVRFRFLDSEKLTKFALSLLDKPFIGILGKILGENALIAQIYLPRHEFRNFIESLSKLAKAGHVGSYDYVIQDLRPNKWSRETIPYQLFKQGSWIYDHTTYIKNLRSLVENNRKQSMLV